MTPLKTRQKIPCLTNKNVLTEVLDCQLDFRLIDIFEWIIDETLDSARRQAPGLSLHFVWWRDVTGGVWTHVTTWFCEFPCVTGGVDSSFSWFSVFCGHLCRRGLSVWFFCLESASVDVTFSQRDTESSVLTQGHELNLPFEV